MTPESIDARAAVLPKTVGIVLFDQVELLDFAGPVEVLWAARAAGADGKWTRAFRILLIADRPGPVATAQGVQVIADCGFEACPPIDVVLIPGGWGTRTQMGNPTLLDWVRHRSRLAELTTSVCTGALVLGAAGLLDGRRATTHRESLDLMRRSFPAIEVINNEQVVCDGAILTSAGVAAGMDLALRIVTHYLGEETARRIARSIEYPFPADNARRVEVRP
jgi:transcriptional regulator GlxA family with amidase domain